MRQLDAGGAVGELRQPGAVEDVRAGTAPGLGLADLDLMFFYSPVIHVGIYLGDGMMVHSSTSGQPVSVVWMGSMPGFVGGSRVA